MIESVGNKFFKSITATADNLGSRFESAFTNFSDKITDDADIIVIEFVSLSNLIKVVLLILIVLLLLVIFKYLVLAVLYLKKQWLRQHIQQTALSVVAVPINVDRRDQFEYDFKKKCQTLGATFSIEAIDDNQFLLKPINGIASMPNGDCS